MNKKALKMKNTKEYLRLNSTQNENIKILFSKNCQSIKISIISLMEQKNSKIGNTTYQF